MMFGVRGWRLSWARCWVIEGLTTIAPERIFDESLAK